MSLRPFDPNSHVPSLGETIRQLAQQQDSMRVLEPVEIPSPTLGLDPEVLEELEEREAQRTRQAESQIEQGRLTLQALQGLAAHAEAADQAAKDQFEKSQRLMRWTLVVSAVACLGTLLGSIIAIIALQQP